MFAAEPFDVRLVASRRLSPAVRELVFERLDGREMAFEPGQWVNLVLPLPGGEIRRAYSIASPPDGSRRFEVAVTRVATGPGSQYLHELGEGDTLRAIGPHGLFTRGQDEQVPALFVATGTGVTPLRSMIRASGRAVRPPPIWLLFGARYEEDILYRDELKAWAEANPGCRYEVTLSQGASSWTGRRGYVQVHVPELWRALCDRTSPAEPHVYVCGLERMVQVVRGLARGELGVGRKAIHTERYD